MCTVEQGLEVPSLNTGALHLLNGKTGSWHDDALLAEFTDPDPWEIKLTPRVVVPARQATWAGAGGPIRKPYAGATLSPSNRSMNSELGTKSVEVLKR